MDYMLLALIIFVTYFEAILFEKHYGIRQFGLNASCLTYLDIVYVANLYDIIHMKVITNIVYAFFSSLYLLKCYKYSVEYLSSRNVIIYYILI